MENYKFLNWLGLIPKNTYILVVSLFIDLKTIDCRSLNNKIEPYLK